jgi:hypothetical protein
MNTLLFKLVLLGGILLIFTGCILLPDLDKPPSKEDSIQILLSGDPPRSLTEIDYYIRCGFEGCTGSLCGRVSKSDFMKLVSKLSKEIDLKKTEPDDFEAKRNFYNLKCWEPKKDNTDFYYSRWRNRRTVIWYQNNKINVYRFSY